MQTRALKYIPLFTAFLLTLGGCLLPGLLDFDEDDYDDYGDSDTVVAPTSFIGKKMVQTVTSNDGQSTTLSIGKSITYHFIDESTIGGESVLATLPTERWSYARTGSKTGTVELVYNVGKSTEYLTFNDGGLSGTYVSKIQFNSGQSNSHSGNFIITDIPKGNDEGPGEEDEQCVVNNTGTLTIFSTNSQPPYIDVSIDGSYVARLTQYYTSGGPACGASSSNATITRTVTAGTHTVSGTASHPEGNWNWSPNTIVVQQCGCSTYTLY
jgi:hypothetical protein